MKKTHKLKYISNRVMCFILAGTAVSLIWAVVLFVLAGQGLIPIWPAIALSAGIMLYLLAGWIWLVRPYRDQEKIIDRFLDGYLSFDGIDYDAASLTPSMCSLMELVDRIVRSPQTMDLNKRQAQYLALQNQINPHFLYNTLESIRGEALIAGLDSVADMTEALAKFFRYTITKVENLVSVEEELDNCETYFWIQKYRFGERLQLHIKYEPEEWEEIMNCRIPKLTLQPILENSIIHGTELKVGTGNLYISFERTQNRLIIRISDDGVGMDEKTLQKLNQRLGKTTDSFTSGEQKQGGIALTNVNNRIRLIFGDEYGMHVYSQLHNGTDVEITIPVVMSDRELKNRGVLR